MKNQKRIQLGQSGDMYRIALVFSFLLQRQQQQSRNKDVFVSRGGGWKKKKKKKEGLTRVEISAI